MPRLHLPRSLYDLFVYDFLYDFFGIVGVYKLRRMCLHCLRSLYDFFRLQSRTKPYRDLGDIIRRPQGYRTIIILSSRPPYINRTMPVRWPWGNLKVSVRPLCNCRVIMCIDLNGYPCSFLHSIWTVVSHKSCYEEASVLVEIIPRYGIAWYVCTLPPIYLSLSNSRWKRIENARKRISFPTRISKIKSKPTIHMRWTAVQRIYLLTNQ